MCRACLDLVEDIERVETALETRLRDMWALLRSSGLLVASSTPDSNDAVHMAALAAGILDDSSDDSEFIGERMCSLIWGTLLFDLKY
jgi:predicted regulator of Ras-like GTPase activity (Roadblock/LC7/MglB family)